MHSVARHCRRGRNQKASDPWARSARVRDLSLMSSRIQDHGIITFGGAHARTSVWQLSVGTCASRGSTQKIAHLAAPQDMCIVLCRGSTPPAFLCARGLYRSQRTPLFRQGLRQKRAPSWLCVSFLLHTCPACSQNARSLGLHPLSLCLVLDTVQQCLRMRPGCLHALSSMGSCSVACIAG